MAATAVNTGRVETSDVQGLVLQGYGKLRAAAYVVLEITDADAGRAAWLRGVLPEISFGEDAPGDGAPSTSRSPQPGWPGSGLPTRPRRGSRWSSCEGMTSAHRSRLLGDEGAGGPGALDLGRTRRPGGPRAAPRSSRRDEDGLAEQLDAAPVRLRRRTGCARWSASTPRTSAAASTSASATASPSRPVRRRARRARRCTPSRPASSCSATSTSTGSTRVTAGAGRRGSRTACCPSDRAASRRVRPRGARAGGRARLRPQRQLPRAAHAATRTSEASGGSWTQATRTPDGRRDAAARTALAARMVGRWPSGAPADPTPDDGPTRARRGQRLRLPRRGPARSRLPDRCARTPHQPARLAATRNPGPHDSIDVGKRHRLIRRGRSYGPPVDPEAALTEDAGPPGRRGLHFIALCADIARQFEFISHTWVMNPQLRGPARRRRPAARWSRRPRHVVHRPGRAGAPPRHRRPRVRHRARRRLLLPARGAGAALPRPAEPSEESAVRARSGARPGPARCSPPRWRRVVRAPTAAGRHASRPRRAHTVSVAWISTASLRARPCCSPVTEQVDPEHDRS